MIFWLTGIALDITKVLSLIIILYFDLGYIDSSYRVLLMSFLTSVAFILILILFFNLGCIDSSYKVFLMSYLTLVVFVFIFLRHLAEGILVSNSTWRRVQARFGLFKSLFLKKLFFLEGLLPLKYLASISCIFEGGCRPILIGKLFSVD